MLYIIFTVAAVALAYVIYVGNKIAKAIKDLHSEVKALREELDRPWEAERQRRFEEVDAQHPYGAEYARGLRERLKVIHK